MRKILKGSILSFFTFAAILALSPITSNATLLDGITIRTDSGAPPVAPVLSGPFDSVVGPGLEVTGDPSPVGTDGVYQVDFMDTMIVITILTDDDLIDEFQNTPLTFNGIRFKDINNELADFTTVSTPGSILVELNAGGTTFDPFSGISLTALGDDIGVDLKGTGPNHSDQTIKLNLTAVPAGTPVPEPSTYALLTFGLGALGFAHRRKMKKGTNVA